MTFSFVFCFFLLVFGFIVVVDLSFLCEVMSSLGLRGMFLRQKLRRGRVSKSRRNTAFFCLFCTGSYVPESYKRFSSCACMLSQVSSSYNCLGSGW